MKKFFIFFVYLAALISCQTKLEQADSLRLENNFDEAFTLYEEAAKEGDAKAMWRLARALGNGDGTDFDNTKAFEWLKKAADKGCEEAKCDLACTYLYGLYAQDKNVEKGESMLKDLEKKSHNSYVLSRLAREYIYGWTFEENKEKAERLLNSVEDKNEPSYLRVMAEISQIGGKKIPLDYKEAIKYYTKAFEKGNTYSAWVLGNIFINGYQDTKKENNISKDITKAIEWYEKGIDANNTDCLCALAYIVFSEDSIVAEYHNVNKGIELLNSAVTHGSAEAMNQLGLCYRFGEFVNKDDEKAKKLFKASYDLHDADGAFNYGLIFTEGENRDIKKAIDIWEKAVEYGSAGAANNLYCYYDCGGYGAKPHLDKEKAKKYLKEAARLGNVVGMRNISREYFYGNNLFEKDEKQAFIYAKKSADLGDVDACQYVAYFYDNAIGCNKDPIEAQKYRDKITPEKKENK